jgi:hypothetical protein
MIGRMQLETPVGKMLSCTIIGFQNYTCMRVGHFAAARYAGTQHLKC